jgi:hypothetical protein
MTREQTAAAPNQKDHFNARLEELYSQSQSLQSAVEQFRLKAGLDVTTVAAMLEEVKATYLVSGVLQARAWQDVENATKVEAADIAKGSAYL